MGNNLEQRTRLFPLSQNSGQAGSHHTSATETAEHQSESEVTQSCLTLCNPMDCSLHGSSLRGILQARVLEWVAISFSRGSSQPRDWTQVSCILGRCFNLWATREARAPKPLVKEKEFPISGLDSGIVTGPTLVLAITPWSFGFPMYIM